jgi:hypothetical protein
MVVIIMLASWTKTKTVQELIDEAFWIRQGLIRYLARENNRPEFKEPLSCAIELLMDFHFAAASVVSGESQEVEAKNQQGEKILRTIRTDLAYVGIDIDRLVGDCKSDNEAARAGKFDQPDPWG